MDESAARLRFLCWADYVAPEVLGRFEQETGIGVDLIEMTSDDDCIARIRAGESFDVAMTADIAAQVLAHAGLLRPLELDLLPNLGLATQPTFRDPPYEDGPAGVRYTAVCYYGTEGFAVRLDMIPHPSSSWEMLFDHANAGRVAFMDDSRATFEPALFLLGSDANCTDAAVLEQATEMMVEVRPRVARFDSAFTGRSIIAGVPVVHCWNGDVGFAISHGVAQVRYILPTEGFSIWADAPSIPTTAEHPEQAHRFLDFLMRPEMAAANADFAGNSPVIPAAAKMVRSLVQQAMAPTDEQLEQGVFLRDLGAANRLYEDAYRRVRGG